jgi:hypothetical protein
MEVETYLFQKNNWDKELDISKDSPQTLLLCFGNLNRYPKLKSAYLELCEKFPASNIVGCSTAGEMKDGEFFEQSLVVALVKFEKSQVEVAIREFKKGDDLKVVGGKLMRELVLARDNLKSVFILSDGIDVNGTRLVQGLNDVLGDKIVLTGGLAGDETEFKSTYLYFNGEIKEDSVLAVGIYGKSILVKSNYRGGWDKFGVERIITSSKDNILYSLNGEPALQVYKRYLGEYSSKLPASALLFPLLVRKDREDNKPKVRTILGIDEKNQAMIFAGDIPEGGLATFMKTNLERLIDAASIASDELVKEFRDNLPDGDMLCISISCVGRRLVLKQRTDEEAEAVKDALPLNSFQVGFYSYGEISPLHNGQCALHNQTMTLTLIGEL